MMHVIATEGAGWLHSWHHLSLRDMVDTALSSDHMAAELAMEVVTFFLGLAVARPWRRLRKHDERHTAEIKALVDQRVSELWPGWTAEMAQEAAKYGSGPLVR